MCNQADAARAQVSAISVVQRFPLLSTQMTCSPLHGPLVWGHLHLHLHLHLHCPLTICEADVIIRVGRSDACLGM